MNSTPVPGRWSEPRHAGNRRRSRRAPGSTLHSLLSNPLALAGPCVLAAVIATPSRAADAVAEDPSPAPESIARLRALSLEDLLNAPVTSLNRRNETLRESAGAAFVISNEDIRRSGARSIPEALRMAPGLGVASMDANKWAISSRGFNNRFADSLLVLVDGRSVYTPDFSGVYWDQVRYPLEDIERIEVIRGPGGAVWGANAVNGVINIITKSSKDTVGGYASGGGGTESRGFADARYGWQLNEATTARAFFSYADNADHPDGYDGWYAIQSGFRVDWQRDANALTFQGDARYSRISNDLYIGRLNPIPGVVPQTYIERRQKPFDDRGVNTLGRFIHSTDEDSEIQVQAYYDRADRNELTLDGVRDTFDVDFQHRFALPLSQSFMYGVGYRYLPDHFRNPDPAYILWEPPERHWQVFSGFVQDEISLVPKELKLSLGSKFEHNDATGWEVQPDARIAWTPSQSQTVWASVGRAVQVPGRNYDGIARIQLPYEPITQGTPLPVFIAGNGTPDLPSETVIAYELGYRTQPLQSVTVDVAGFYNVYDYLTVGGLGPTRPVPDPYLHLETSSVSTKAGEADTWGAELSVGWQANDWSRFTLAYTFFQSAMDLGSSSLNLFKEGADPENQVSLRATFDLPGNFDLDLWGRWVDRLPAYSIDGYFDFDIRLAWRPKPWLEVSLVGQNLIDDRRPEFGPDPNVTTPITEVPRGAYLQFSARF